MRSSPPTCNYLVRVHFSGLTKKEREAKVRLDSVADFACGHAVYVHSRLIDPVIAPSSAVA